MNSRIAGRYQIVRQLGGGGMGDVFQAVDVETGQAVAAKVLRPTDEDPLDALLRFQQEGTVLSTLRHPNIVQVFGTFLEDQTACIIMEFLEGRDLSQVLQSGPVSLERVKTIGTQVAAALAYAHDRGIIHRDVKPDNIMVVGNDHVKVADFGIARILRPGNILSTAAGVSIGTPLYMAPEQIEGESVDGRTDIYSLGVVLYHMVTGRPPFLGDSPLSIAFKHVHEQPDPPRTIKANIPEAWEAVILKALAKDPDERYPTALDLQNALAGLDTNVSTTAVGADDAVATNSGHGTAGTLVKPGVAVREDWQRKTSAGLPDEVTPAYEDGDLAKTRTAAEQKEAPGATTLPPAAGLAAATTRGEASHASTVQPPETGPPVTHAKTGHAERTPGNRRLLWSGGAVLVAVVAVIVGFLLLHSSSKPQTPISSPKIAIWLPGQFKSPSALEVDRHGSIFVADTGNSRVLRLSPAGKVLQTIGGKSASSRLSAPTGVAVDQFRNVYVGDTGNNRIVKFSRSGKLLWTWQGQGTDTGKIRSPGDVAIGALGNLYVADTGDSQIQHLSSDGTWQTPYLGFNHPVGVTVGTRANFFVADTGGNAVEELAWSSDVLNTSKAGLFAGPQGVAVDKHENVYVADTGNNRVVKLSPSFAVLKIWGGQGSTEFDHPAGVAVDSRGRIYVSDTGHNRIGRLISTG